MEGTASKIEEEVEMKAKISPELVKKYREVFDGFDKEQDGYVQAKDVPGVLRILGVVMTEQESKKACYSSCGRARRQGHKIRQSLGIFEDRLR